MSGQKIIAELIHVFLQMCLELTDIRHLGLVLAGIIEGNIKVKQQLVSVQFISRSVIHSASLLVLVS